ncbi:tripartite tricarboxylate transporter substrate binding protein [Paraburkholderia fungorum]|jgi:tripartite-type tricarboxylate transporter receptor subunit TctC|uniref:tripartite tricarboxylate transporter substrate binding protein n=1 Tax=Paraburkholderia fungorum TaxID=134537 RepID=UPI0038B942A4
MNNRWSTRSFRRCMGQALTLGALALTSIASFAADDYPSRPVTIIVPFAAGGSADVYARIVAQQLSAQLKQSFIVDDRPGAGAIIGTEYVAQSKPDGYTLLLISNTHTVNETLYTRKPFKLMSDFVPVAPINSSDLVLVTRPGLGVNSVADLIKLARSEPGKLSYASSGYGTPYHMAGELFKQMAGVSILHVPYKGSSNARTDVIGGQVDMMFDATTTMTGFISSGKAKALATTGAVRSDLLPNLPTVDQSGVPKYNAVIWLGLMAPKGTPPAVVDRLNAALTRIVATPQIKASWQKQGADTMSMNPAQFTQFMNDDIKKWAQVVKVSGAKVDQ